MSVQEVKALETHRAKCLESVIRVLEGALAEARAGDVVAVGVAFVRPTGKINFGFSESDNVGNLLGAVAHLQYRILRRLENDE